MASDVRISVTRPKGDRVYHVNENDVRVVLNRLPTDVCQRLRAVHFNDRSWGARTLGYVNRGRREIALCAMPARISLGRFLFRGEASPQEFGAARGRQWPALAIRRLVLYDVLLHELGHLQVVNERAKSERRRFAMEKFARDFSKHWRRLLWSRPFSHPDPVHNPPSLEELAEQGVKWG